MKFETGITGAFNPGPSTLGPSYAADTVSPEVRFRPNGRVWSDNDVSEAALSPYDDDVVLDLTSDALKQRILGESFGRICTHSRSMSHRL
jgi:hypothetical protein